MNNDDDAPAKRSDVGYKRPPVEHQFKKGEKPPPRKPKPDSEDETPAELLWRLLHEERRVKVGKDIRWATNAELLILKAFQLADAGGIKMQRLCNELLMIGTPADDAEDEPIFTLVRGPALA